MDGTIVPVRNEGAGWVSITWPTVGAASEVASENSFHTENGPGNHHRVRLVGLAVP